MHNERSEDRAGGEQHWRAWFSLFVLLCLYVLAYVDRQILAYMVEPVQRDFAVSDTLISLLLGLAFAGTYTLVAFPVARLADSGNRRNIMLWGTAIWSLATCLCGLARQFWMLLLARMGVGFGEAFLNPAAVSFLSDRFSYRHRGRVMGIYMMALPIGNGLANMLGGMVLPELMVGAPLSLPLLGVMPPWRLLLVILGLTGGLLMLLLLCIPEPERRGSLQHDAVGRPVRPPLRTVLQYARHNHRALIGIAAPLVVSAFLTLGVGYWLPSYFLRSFGLSASQAGEYLYAWGLISLLAGIAGVLLGGFLADWARRRWQSGLWGVLILGVLLVGPAYLAVALAPGPGMALYLLVPATLGNGILQATGITTLMSIVPNQMRSLMSALFFFIVNMIGAGLGPTMVAFVTDYVFATPDLLRYSIFVITLPLVLFSLYSQWSGLKSYTRLLASCESDEQLDITRNPHR